MSSPFVPDDDAVSSSDTSGSTDTGGAVAADSGLSAAEGSEPVGAIRLDDPPQTRRPRPQFTVQAAKTAARDGVAATRRRTRDWLELHRQRLEKKYGRLDELLREGDDGS